MRLANKIGIVTAAASGIGRAGALRFAAEGAAVGVVDVDAQGVEAVVAEIEAAGGRAKGIAADLTRDDESRRIVGETASTFGGLAYDATSPAASWARPPRRSAGSTSSGTMWAIRARRPSRTSTWPTSTSRST